jgi:hypothetical protein
MRCLILAVVALVLAGAPEAHAASKVKNGLLAGIVGSGSTYLILRANNEGAGRSTPFGFVSGGEKRSQGQMILTSVGIGAAMGTLVYLLTPESKIRRSIIRIGSSRISLGIPEIQYVRVDGIDQLRTRILSVSR